MIIRSVLLAAIMTSAAGAASAQYFPQPAYVPPLRMPRDVIRLRFANRIEALRQEALAQRHADGGVLTPSHKDGAAVEARPDPCFLPARGQSQRPDERQRGRLPAILKLNRQDVVRPGRSTLDDCRRDLGLSRNMLWTAPLPRLDHG